jgi:hypothetical protein
MLRSLFKRRRTFKNAEGTPEMTEQTGSRTSLSLDGTGSTFLGHVLEGIRVTEEDMSYWNGHINELHAGLRFLHRPVSSTASWIDKLVEREKKCQLAFFDKTELDEYAAVLQKYGSEKVEWWSKLGLEVHAFPTLALTSDLPLPGWMVKPGSWYWQVLAENRLRRLNSVGDLTMVSMALIGGVVLINTRCKPRYQDGKQMFASDRSFMGQIIERLRKSGKLARYEYGPQTSRFGISSVEWQDHLRPAVAEFLGLEPQMMRLETAPEANIIPQIYPHMPRKKDGETNTWMWYEEYFESSSFRLSGGHSGGGGLADVDYSDAGSHWAIRAVRPLGVLSL